MRDSILWELTKVPRHMGGTTGIALYAFGIAMLGILAPLYFGAAMLNTRVLLMYACLPLLLTPPLVAEAVAGERDLKPETGARQREWLYGKIGAGAVYGWASVVVVVVLAFLSLRLSPGRFDGVPVRFAAGVALVSAAASLFAASVAAAVAIGARSAKSAKRAMRQGLLLLLIVILYLSRQPWSWTRRLAVPNSGPEFLEFAIVMSVVFTGFSAGLARLALRSAESTEIRLNL